MKYQHIFAFAAVIFATGYLLRSLQPAHAFPQGANVSLGSNPIFSFSSSTCSGGETVTTVPSDQVLIITDVILSGSSSETVQLKTGAGTLLGYFRAVNNYSQAHYNFFLEGRTYALRSGIVVPAGENLVLHCDGNYVTISGYFAQS